MVLLSKTNVFNKNEWFCLVKAMFSKVCPLCAIPWCESDGFKISKSVNLLLVVPGLTTAPGGIYIYIRPGAVVSPGKQEVKELSTCQATRKPMFWSLQENIYTVTNVKTCGGMIASPSSGSSFHRPKIRDIPYKMYRNE